MGKITLSAEVAAILRALPSQTELYGPDGRPLGLFVPPDDSRLYAEPTIEQLNAIAAGKGGIPHDEVVKRLGLE